MSVIIEGSRGRETVRLLARDRVVLGAVTVLGLVVLAAIVGPLVTPYPPNAIDVPNRLLPPSLAHPFGTDELGRDVFSRVIVGARVSVQVGVVAVGLSFTAGVPAGLVAGFYGGKVDDVIMRIMDVLYAFRAILLAIAILAVLGPGITNAMIAISIVYTPIFARVTRSSALSVRQELYVRAARSCGASDLRLLRLHILPGVLGPVIVQTSLSLAFAILAEAALSFLGLGTQPPDPSWGRMLSEARGFVGLAPWMVLFPGLAIFGTILALNLLGDAMRDVLDPRSRSALEAQRV